MAVWQLWRELRLAHPQLANARIHFITTEKYPVTIADLRHILALWGERAPELGDLVTELLAAYPALIAGCHRLHFDQDNVTLDMWLGDAADSLSRLERPVPAAISGSPAAYLTGVDAWFLDGFAPSCNQALWDDSIFAQMQRLSHAGTTAATFSCAGVVKRGLQQAGFAIKKVRGFGRKREMLTAVMLGASADNQEPADTDTAPKAATHTIVIGAGISGLMMAWSLARRGGNVTLVDKSAPLSGASGNPRALLAPKMTPLPHADEHLHTIGYLYSSRFYRSLQACARKVYGADILEPTGTLDILTKANVNTAHINAYPDAVATTLPIDQAKGHTGLTEHDLSEHLYLPQAGLVNPQALAQVVLAHPFINAQTLHVNHIDETDSHVAVNGYRNELGDESLTLSADHVVICAAYHSHDIDARIFDCRKIRGQLSWFTPSAEQLAKLPKIPLKYGGYCAPFVPKTGDAALNQVNENNPQFLLGASFVRNETQKDIRASEHQHNRDKLTTALPEMDAVLPSDVTTWHARVGIRAQTPDYHPLVGQVGESTRLWTLCAMGSKGYAFAPICAEALADIMFGNFAPLSSAMLKRLSPNRTRLQTPLS